MMAHVILYFISFFTCHINAHGAENIGYFWHISDFHLDTRYGNNTRGHDKEYFLGGYDEGCWTEQRGVFGDYNCDSPLALIESATGFMKEYQNNNQDKDIDFIVWTGDDTAHANESVFTREEVLETIRVISEKIGTVGLQVFPSLGNHDIIPKNQFPTPDLEDSWTTYYDDVADIWDEVLNIDKNITNQFRENGGFYNFHLPETPSLSLLSLNSNLWYKSNHQVEGQEDPGDQISWLENILNSAQAAGEKLLIFSHIPPGKFERFYQFCGEEKGCDLNGGYHGFHWLAKKFNARYIELVEKYSLAISGQLFAHHHTDSFKVFLSSGGEEPVSWALLAPGVSPMNSTLAPETGANNPGIRLFKYDKINGQIIDYDQFYLDLAQANSAGNASWGLEYSFLEYYSLTHISAAEISNLVLNIKDDKEVFKKYYKANTVMFEEATEENCDATCMRYHFCALYQLDYQEFEDCVVPSSANHNTIFSVIFIFFHWICTEIIF